MTWTRVLYGVVMLLCIGVGMSFRYARRNDVELPWWMVLLGVLVIVGTIAFGVWWQKRRG